MATPLTHALFALAAGKAAIPHRVPARFWILTAICAAAPDVDFLWQRFIFDRSGMLAHRGIAHSLPAALLCGLLTAFVYIWWRRRPSKAGQDDDVAPSAAIDARPAHGPARDQVTLQNSSMFNSPMVAFLATWLALALATASHSMLDMLSTRCRGVMLLAPLDNQRFAFAWQPIWYMPEWIERLFTHSTGLSQPFTRLGLAVLSEITVVWLPMLALILISVAIRRGYKNK
jgi:inner membrane protein